MPDFDGRFQTENIPPFLEAVDRFLELEVVTPAQFAALSAEMRQKAFTAARVYEADQLLAVYDALFKALYQGGVYPEFSKAVQGIITNPWHRRTVFNTNILSAYGAGHWEQAQATKELRPFACFRAVIDGRTSPGCYRLNGVTMPLDSAYVRANWCPRHHNCRSQWITLSRWEVDDLGLKIEENDADLPPANPKFRGPALGGNWEPDYGKYPAWLAAQLKAKVERAIYD